LNYGLQKVIDTNEELKLKFSEGINNEKVLKCEILRAIENEKLEVLKKLEDLKIEYADINIGREHQQKQILRLSKDLSHRTREARFLQEAKWKLEAELITSKIDEAFLKEEILELNEAHQSASEARRVEIEQLKETIIALEGENGGLKTQLASYVSGVLSLAECISSLENCTTVHKDFYKSKKEVVKVIFPLPLMHHMLVDLLITSPFFKFVENNLTCPSVVLVHRKFLHSLCLKSF